MSCFLYLACCGDGTLYTGVAADPFARERAHNAGRGAKYTRARLPITTVYAAPCVDRSDALRRERMVKRLPRAKKLAMIRARQKPGIEFSPALTMDSFAAMAALEADYYGAEHIAPAEAAFAWYCAYPFTTVAAFRHGQLAGFVNLFPVTKDVSAALNAGTFDDSMLTVTDIVDPAHSDGSLPLFLSCAAVARPWRGTGLSTELLWAALQPYLPYADRIDTVWTDNVTEAGARLSHRLGLTDGRASLHGSTIYCGKYAAFADRLKALQPRYHPDDPIEDML